MSRNKKEKVMSKSQDTKKGSKKEPAKSMKEKKQDKRDKKNGLDKSTIIIPK